MRTGCPTHIMTRIPHQRELAKGVERQSREARRRLKIVDWYRMGSRKFSASWMLDATLTCRHFGIHRSYLSRWRAMYSKGGARA